MRASSPLLLALALGACASNAPPPPSSAPLAPPVASTPAPAAPQEQERALRPLQNATCVIRTENVALVDPIPLAYGGKEFATVQHARRIELRAAHDAATMEVSTEHFAAVGEVQLEDILIGPRSSSAPSARSAPSAPAPSAPPTRTPQPHDEWLTIFRARAKSISNDTLAVEVTLPSFVTPAAPLSVTYPCNELTFQPEVEPVSYDFRYLKRGTKIPLRSTPRGPVVAWLLSPSDEPPEQVAELERKGRAVRIAIPDADVTIQGWVDASALSSKFAPAAELVGALIANPSNPNAASTAVQCSADVPFYVRADASPVRVGTLRGSTIIHHGPANERGEVPIDLGLDAASLPPPLQPFIRAAAIAGCIEAAGR
ncbi:hypothetical protein LZC95_26520 [Pendulispora brunnea]|uniref:Uncharacterized protein n=1 Tax=Pendulispora brunnea TaxID=2905690 RepID=A0ABZ2JU97_9BACT